MQKRCYECMEPIEDFNNCSNCGFNNGALKDDGILLKAGSIIKSRYYIGNVFSKSLDSTVYLAYDEELDKKVFVREFTGEKSQSLFGKYTAMELRQKFLSYAKSTATINMCDILPHTVDVFAEKEGSYLVTDYFDGESLKTLLESGVNIGSSGALKMVQQLLSGLKHIHSSGMIFGSISPETLYILKNGEVRLFGIMSSFYDFLEDIDKKVEVLNPSYAAPEMFQKTSRVGAYTDVYSASAILYRLLTKEIPAISFLRSGGENLIPPKKLDKNIPKNIQIALLNALNWQAENRTATPKKFLKELSSQKVKRKLSGFIIWANVLGFFQSIYDKFIAKRIELKERKPKAIKKPNKKIKFLWLWITIPAVILALIISGLIIIKSFGSADKNTNLSSVLNADGELWYYGSGIETPSNSSKYVYGGYSSKKSDFSNDTSSKSSSETSSLQDSSKADPNIIDSPWLVGISLEMAKKELEEKGFLIGDIVYETSTKYAPNYVISQSPVSGKKVQKGSKVDLVVAKGAEIPDIVGLDIVDAQKKLSQASFYNIKYNFEKSEKTVGSVTKVYFESETKQTHQDKVIVVVSGEEISPISNYVGKTVAEAKTVDPNVTLVFVDKEGAKILDMSEADESIYTILEQDILQKTPAYKGITLTLTVVISQD